jgi:hypothetical protein
MRIQFPLPLLLSRVGAQAFAGSPVAANPNIVFILADDLGWSDTTPFGTTQFCQTPNLERLAKRAMPFTHADQSAGKDTVQLDWIELKPAQGKAQRWDF